MRHALCQHTLFMHTKIGEKMNPQLYDIEKIKDQARRSVQAGAVTENYPLDVKEACRLLNEALATDYFISVKHSSYGNNRSCQE